MLDRIRARPIAHRGLHACGGPGPVENSLSAARAAILAGYGIECDIQLSADGEAVVFHDDRLERLTAAGGATADRSLAALTALALGGSDDRIPPLAAFLAAVDGLTPLVIEIKRGPPGDLRLADRALDLVSDYRGPVALESFDPMVVDHCLARGAPCPVGLVGPPEDGSAAAPALLARCAFASWRIDRLADLAAAHPNLPRTTWTIRALAQQTLAQTLAAQIVFEGFVPR